MRRGLRRHDRRQAAPPGGRGRDRRAARGLASGCGRRRRQDRRRRRYLPADPAGLPARADQGRQEQLRPGRGRHGLPAAHRLHRPGALPHDRRDRDPGLRLLDPRLAPGAGRHHGDRREGDRDAARDRADHRRQPQGRQRRRLRARAVPGAPAHREPGAGRAHQRLLHLLAVLPLGDLQGPVPRRAALDVLPRPAGPALRLELRRLPPALLDQHLAVLAARPAVPHARPQRRDQHAARQPQLDEEPRDPDGLAGVRRLQRGRQADRPGRQLRQRSARRGGRGAGARRALAAAHQDAAEPAGLGQADGDPAGPQGPVQLLQLRDGAVGRPGRRGRLRRPLGDRRHGPQRPAPDALHAHRGRPAGGRLRDRHGAARRSRDRREGPRRPGRDGRHRPQGRQVLSRPRAQGPARRREAVRPLGQAHHASRQSDGQVPLGARADGARRAQAPAEPLRHLDRGARAAARADGAGRQGGARLDGRRHADGGALDALPRPPPLLPPAVQPGHQPADRPAARIPGDEPEDALRQPRQRLRPGAEPDQDPAAREPAPADPRAQGAARPFRPQGRDDRLHVRGRRRPRRLARGAGADPQRGRGRGARRLRADPADRRGELGDARADADDPRVRCRAQPPRAPGPAQLQLDHRAQRRMPGCPLRRGADRRGCDRAQPLPRRGGDRRPPRPRPVPGPDAAGVPHELQGGDQPGPAQDHVEDGHLDRLELSRRLQLRGGGPLALALRRVLPGADHADLGHRARRHPEQGAGAAPPRLGGRQPAAHDRRPLPLPPRRRAPRARGPAGPPAAVRRGERFLRRLQEVRRADLPARADRAARPAGFRPPADRRADGRGRIRSPRSGSASSRPACRWARSRPRRTRR